ncbi:MAG: DUF882 domain-containing protein [Aquificaceae bacterium]|nr:DUF882 domain-containing protein [Aquificaceae bacterium]
MSRREALKYIATGVAGLLLPKSLLANEGLRVIDLYSIHTGERLKTTYWVDGHYIKQALSDINYLLRDHRADEVHPIDVRLLDFLYAICCSFEASKVIVISGYRTPATNAYLRRISSGVARESYHMYGRAIDFYIEGVELSQVRNLAIALGLGGVGYYPSSGFIHLDTGPFRTW